MRLISKIVAGVAVCSLFFSSAYGEQIIFGAEVAPQASLVVLGGNTNMDMTLLTAAGANVPTGGVSATKFFVNTNMPKWNVYVAFANGGALKSLGAPSSVALQDAWIKVGKDLNITAPAGAFSTIKGNYILLDATTSDLQDYATIFNTAAGAGVVKGDGTALDGTGACTGADCDFDNWLVSSDVNTSGFDLIVGAAGQTAPKIAGVYSEIFYVTLATTY